MPEVIETDVMVLEAHQQIGILPFPEAYDLGMKQHHDSFIGPVFRREGTVNIKVVEYQNVSLLRMIDILSDQIAHAFGSAEIDFIDLMKMKIRSRDRGITIMMIRERVLVDVFCNSL